MKRTHVTILFLAIAFVALLGIQQVSALSSKDVWVIIVPGEGGTLSWQGTYDRLPVSGTVRAPTLPDTFQVDPSTFVTISAIPHEGWTFAYWTLNGQIVDRVNPYHHQVTSGIGTESAPLTAVFVPAGAVPEYPLAGLAAILSCFGGFVVFKKRNSLPKLFYR